MRHSSSMDGRLRRAIATPRIQQQAEELVRLALKALEDLKQLDESLYERYIESRRAVADSALVSDRIRALASETFHGLLELLEYSRALLAENPIRVEEVQEVDFGDLEAIASAPSASDAGLDFGSVDFGELGDLLENLDESKRSDADHWSEVIEKLSSIEYGLRTQYEESMSRLEMAITSGEISQVLGVLDDATSDATEGVHAVVTAVYSAFVPEVDATTIVPKYLTSLARALMVRRALAELAVPLTSYNTILQDPAHAAEHPAALEAIRELVRGFVKSPVCHAMRPADRVQIEELERELRESPTAVARLTSEGLVKYIESLGSINQREVLVQHDRRTLDEIREAMAGARQLVDLSPRTATEMLGRAYSAVQRLRGRNPATDAMIAELEGYAPEDAPERGGMQLLEKLEQLLVVADS